MCENPDPAEYPEDFVMEEFPEVYVLNKEPTMKRQFREDPHEENFNFEVDKQMLFPDSLPEHIIYSFA